MRPKKLRRQKHTFKFVKLRFFLFLFFIPIILRKLLEVNIDKNRLCHCRVLPLKSICVSKYLNLFVPFTIPGKNFSIVTNLLQSNSSNNNKNKTAITTTASVLLLILLPLLLPLPLSQQQQQQQ